MNHEREPYNNCQVRQAIQLAIDRDAFNTVVLRRPTPSRTTSRSRAARRYYFDDYAYERTGHRRGRCWPKAGFPDGFDDEVIVPNSVDSKRRTAR